MRRVTIPLILSIMGCAPSTADLPNDQAPLARDAGRDARVVRDARQPSPDDDEPTSEDEPPDDEPTDDAPVVTRDASVRDSSRDVEDATPPATPDAGGEDPEPPQESKIAGTYGMCTSSTKMSGDQCFGYYCKATEADIVAETVANAGPCSGVDPALICEGLTSQEVGKCSRSVKSDPANAFASKEELRELVKQCTYKVARIEQEVPEECLACYLDAASCASDNCLIQCLPGDSKECDKCRTDSGCNQPVPSCAGLPSPF
jgi:hypothetical protein